MPLTNTASKFFTNAIDLTTTDQTTVYTVPNNYSAVVKALILANTDSANRTITLQWYHKDTNATKPILEGHSVTGSNFEAVFNDNVPIYLHAGDILYVTAATANTIVVTVSVEEYYDPNRV
jgi:hypothetical protein